MEESIPALIQEHGMGGIEAYESLLTREEQISRYRPSDVSFSKERDALPQWRAYCSKGNGVCIGFRVPHLQGCTMKPVNAEIQSLCKPSIRLEPVSYVEETDSSRIASLALEAFKEAKNHFEGLSVEDQQSIPLHAFFFFYLEAAACLVKHPSFRAESEYRLIADDLWHSAKYYSYRATQSTLVPYIKLQLPEMGAQELPGSELNKNCFVESVTVGPTPHFELTCRALKYRFLSYGAHVKIYESEAPFRDW